MTEQQDNPSCYVRNCDEEHHIDWEAEYVLQCERPCAIHPETDNMHWGACFEHCADECQHGCQHEWEIGQGMWDGDRDPEPIGLIGGPYE